jgi:hypothetical protein
VVLDLMTHSQGEFVLNLTATQLGNLQKASLRIRREENAYPHIVKIIEGVKEAD